MFKKDDKCITQERLKEVLRYDSLTGVFIWKKRMSKRIPVGGIAGSVDDQGYWKIRIDNKRYDKWVSQIKSNGKNKHLGYFDYKEDAIKCRKKAEKEYGFSKLHGSAIA
jgi:hypothetical protein